MSKDFPSLDETEKMIKEAFEIIPDIIDKLDQLVVTMTKEKIEKKTISEELETYFNNLRTGLGQYRKDWAPLYYHLKYYDDIHERLFKESGHEE